MTSRLGVVAMVCGALLFVAALVKTPPAATPLVTPRDEVLRAEALPPQLEPLRNNAQPKLAPAEGDWLEAHEEAGQSVAEHAAESTPIPERVIYLVPTGQFTPEADALLTKLEPLLAAHFQLTVKRLPALDGTKAGRSPRENTFGTQWLTLDVLDALRDVKPADAAAVMAVTTVDLYPDPSWNFVFGQASYEDRVGVTSLARVGDLAAEPLLVLERTYATSMHEIGHMLQLQHCIAWECPMNGSNNQEEADSRPLEPCPHCLAKLMHTTKLEPKKRFTELRRAFDAAGLERGVREIDRELANLEP
ncbi:MAG: archaemetzincin [Archangium sp.]